MKSYKPGVVEEGVLRAHIRSYLRESQGATTQTYETSPTSPSFRPFSLLPGLAIAAGTAALAQTHEWISSLPCTPLTEKANFPIKLSKKYADKILSEFGSQGKGPISDNTLNNYKKSLYGSDKGAYGATVDTSDLWQHEELLAELLAAANVWPKTTKEFDELNVIQATVVTALNKAYGRFSGCGEAFTVSEDFQLSTYANYIKFLNDVAFISHSDFTNGLAQQKVDLIKVKQIDINTTISEALKTEASLYRQFQLDMPKP